MNYLKARLIRQLVQYFGSDDRRIDHALRVLRYAEELAGERPGCDLEIVQACALLHDVGIKVAEAKHGYNDGPTQELYGPPVAAELLADIGFPTDKIEVVKHIIGNHHSRSRYDYPELAVLKEADRRVNIEDGD